MPTAHWPLLLLLLSLLAFLWQAARSVVAIDGSREHCGNFLKSQEGACSVQNGVHLYCIRPHEAESPPTDESPPTGDDSQGGKFPEQNREKSISLSSLSQGNG